LIEEPAIPVAPKSNTFIAFSVLQLTNPSTRHKISSRTFFCGYEKVALALLEISVNL
jgi:hypothetical protein